MVISRELKRWEGFHALALVYRDAYFSQLVDRYQARWREYTRLARNARESFVAAGIGLVKDPLRRAAVPALSSTPGPQAGGAFYAGVAWTNAEGQEGQTSEAGSITIVDSNLMVVTPVAPPANVRRATASTREPR